MISKLPDDGLAVVEREVVRVVVQDGRGDVLLLHARDLSDTSIGTWWELPGGGIEAGETFAETAARELIEETGIVIDSAGFGEPTWRRDATFRYRGRRHLQHEVVMLARIATVAPALDVSGRTHYEVEDYHEHRWWTVAEIEFGHERFYPSRLPALLGDLLAGRWVDEPLEVFN